MIEPMLTALFALSVSQLYKYSLKSHTTTYVGRQPCHREKLYMHFIQQQKRKYMTYLIYENDIYREKLCETETDEEIKRQIEERLRERDSVFTIILERRSSTFQN